MAWYIMILRGATSLFGALEGVGPCNDVATLKIITYCAIKTKRFACAISGPKKVSIFRAHPFQWPCNDVAPLKIIKYYARKTTGTLIVIIAFPRNQIKIKSSVDKAFWDETKSFLQYKATSLELKRGKTHVNQFFQSFQVDCRRRRTTSQGAKPLLKRTCISPGKDFNWFLGLKGQDCLYRTCFCQPSAKLPSPPLFSIIGSEKRCQDVLPAPLLLSFTPATFYFFLKVKSELASCFREERLGRRPQHRYRRARCWHPVVDRALQKNHTRC
jgi:hypothetical protein